NSGVLRLAPRPCIPAPSDREQGRIRHPELRQRCRQASADVWRGSCTSCRRHPQHRSPSGLRSSSCTSISKQSSLTTRRLLLPPSRPTFTTFPLSATRSTATPCATSVWARTFTWLFRLTPPPPPLVPPRSP